SCGVEATVVVKNPCEFPIEFYSLDYDEQYLQEEEILRMLRQFHGTKAFRVPPRGVGETLPPEVLQYYEAWMRRKAQQAEAKAMAEENARAKVEAKAKAKAGPAEAEPMPEMLEEPLTRALERHLGIDWAAENKPPELRGIIVIIHGAPRTGKTAVAAGLAEYYGASCFSIDDIVKDTIAYN
ncbi:HYDIN protein, partial [Origma solitaria]|nr:HYDIN protein [Origma solitaria]